MIPDNVKKHSKGFSLVEVLVVIGITVIIFGALFVAFEYSLKLIAQSRAKLTALSLSTDRAEYIRSLPYSSVGTVAGIPNGSIPQNRTVTLNGINFAERVLIEYVDDPADGLGVLDSNSILADYKKVKIEYTWLVGGVAQSFSLITNVVPKSIETTAGGGTIRVNVFDANVLPLQGIDVRLINNTTTSTVDVTRKTDATGTAFFTGAPAAAGYQIFVSAPGYSSDQTRVATTSLPYPLTLPVAVLESDVSTMNFQIDKLSSLTIKVFNSEVINSSVENFDDLLSMSDVSNTNIVSSTLALTEVGGVYDLNGSVTSNLLAPATIESWGVAEIEAVTPGSTDVRVRFYSSTSSATLIPETDLPGNLVGFSTNFINLSGLSVSSYPSLVVGVFLSTTDTSVTPTVDKLTIHYVESRNVVSGDNLTITGNKVIGSDDLFSPVYKLSTSTVTDSNGEVRLENIEWDSYSVTPGAGLVIKEACSENPFSLNPDTDESLSLLVGASSADNLRVVVNNATGERVIGAAVKLSRGASVWNADTSWCGQTYFGGLVNAADYDLEVSAAGYTTQLMSSINVSGDTVQTVVLNP